jgi:hypothetical protein
MFNVNRKTVSVLFKIPENPTLLGEREREV